VCEINGVPITTAALVKREFGVSSWGVGQVEFNSHEDLVL